MKNFLITLATTFEKSWQKLQTSAEQCQNRRQPINTAECKKIEKGIMVLLLLLSLGSAIGFAAYRTVNHTSNKTTGIIINNDVYDVYTKAKKAEKNSALVSGVNNLEVVTDAKIISITITSNNQSWSADSDNIVSNLASIVSDPAIVHNDGNTFTLNANACEENEIAIMEITTYSGSKLDKLLDKKGKTFYFAFTAQHDEVISEESSEESSDDSTAEAMPSGTVLFNGDSYTTYASQDDALKSPINIPGTNVTGCAIKAIPSNDTTARMRLIIAYVDGQTSHVEKFLYEDNDWSSQMDFSSFAGKTIVLGIASETGDLIPKVSYEYVAFKVPSTPEPQIIEPY
jgi:hypothetical protein